ncbi:MAG: hypothetical protein AAGF47_00200 [Planctomycetota bacterium]
MTEQATATEGAPAESIIGLVAEQLSLCGRLDELSGRQHELIEADGAESTDELLRVLGERQTVIEQIAGVSTRLGPFRSSWESHIALLGEAERERVRGMLGSLETMMRRVAERDEADRQTMETRRNTVRDLAGGVTRSNAAVNAYGSAPTKGPRYQDRSA